MKKFASLFFACAFALTISAQQAGQTTKIPSTYDRSAITFLQLDFPGEIHAADLKSKVSELKFTEKYYINNLPVMQLPTPFNRADLTANRSELIRLALEKSRIPNDIIALWYAQKADGSMSLDLIHERGMFNATDETFVLAKTTKRGNASLEDYGNRLINRSYILVMDYQGLRTMEEDNQPTYRGWKATAIGYLYKIDYTEEIQNKLYDAWIYEDDSPQVKADKKQKLSQIEFPLKYVTMTAVPVETSQLKERSSTMVLLFPNKTPEQLLKELIQKGYDENLYSLETTVEDFKVKTTINQVKPIRAKIGKKEGIRTDYRFFAYEYVYNEKTNAAEQKFRGVIRSTNKIVDNNAVTKGSTGTSEFYQTAGRKLETGYLLHQRNDYGVELGLAPAFGEVGGFTGRLDARLGRYVGIQALYVYLEGGMDAKTYPNYYNTDEAYAFIRYDVGLAKGFQLNRNMEVRPYLGYGKEETTDSYLGDVSTVYYKA
ncbi:MAG: hypothetical protein NTY32_01075, partial [Bacteroidia bacterium]|nr:hypothetical protein [Bacteroidia bacterium]